MTWLSPLARVEAIGFVWAHGEHSKAAAWEESYSQLVAYKEANGDVNVSKRDKKLSTARLGNWVSKQRTTYSQGTLSAERIARLEGIGFVWDPYDVAWEESYSQLVAYKEANGHTNVPLVRKLSTGQLGRWVSHQRQDYKAGKLSTERIERLEDLGFFWVVQKRSVGT